jgi:hypothetical protein
MGPEGRAPLWISDRARAGLGPVLELRTAFIVAAKAADKMKGFQIVKRAFQ